MLRDRARLCMKLSYTADVPKELHPTTKAGTFKLKATTKAR